MNKGLLVLGSKKYGEVSLYEVEKTVDSTLLKYSKAQPTWTKPGEAAYSLTNTGNEFVLEDHLTKQKIKIDFCQAEALRALLKLTDDNNDSTFNYYEKK